MDKKQKSLLISIALLLVGGLIGFGVASRHYGVGPLAGLQSQYSTANFARTWWVVTFESCNPGTPTGRVKKIAGGGLGGGDLTLKECTGSSNSGGD